MVPILGLAGYAGAGKDTVAGFLAERGYQRVAFGDVLREAALALDPMVETVPFCRDGSRLSTLVRVYGWDWAKREYPDVRGLLQRLGTDVGRAFFGEDCWVRAAFDRLPAGRVVFADVRFPNEARAIQRAGGLVWRVHRHGYGPVNAHPSETALDDYDFDWHVWNNGDLAALRQVVLHDA